MLFPTAALPLQDLPSAERNPFTPNFFLAPCWVLCGFLHLKKIDILRCWSLRTRSQFSTVGPQIVPPCPGCSQAGVSRSRALSWLSFTYRVPWAVAPTQHGSGCAQLLHSPLSTLHFHVLFNWWSSWTSMFLPVFCHFTVWKDDELPSQRVMHIELFSPTNLLFSSVRLNMCIWASKYVPQVLLKWEDVVCLYSKAS